MIKAGDLKKGVVLNLDNTLFRVLNTEYNKPGRGSATMRVQLLNIRTGQTGYRVFSAEDGLDNLFVEQQAVTFLYKDGDTLFFMNKENYEQYEVNEALFGDDMAYLRNDMDLELSVYDEGTVIDYRLPTTITYTVTDAEVVAVGNTAGSVQKAVRTETGLVVNVPNFINIGEKIVVDSRDKTYVGRG